MRYLILTAALTYSLTALSQKQTIKIVSSAFNLSVEASEIYSKLLISENNDKNTFWATESMPEAADRYMYTVGIKTEWFPGKSNQRYGAVTFGVHYMRHGGMVKKEDPNTFSLYYNYNDPDYDLVMSSIRFPIGASVYYMLGKKSKMSLGLAALCNLRYTVAAEAIEQDGSGKYNAINDITRFGFQNFTMGPVFRYRRFYARYDFNISEPMHFYKDPSEYGESWEKISAFVLGFYLMK